MRRLSGKWSRYAKLTLPLWVGLILAGLAWFLLPFAPPTLTTIDIGIFGLVLGLSIRNTAVFAFLLGFFITGVILFVRYWDKRRADEAHTLYADFVEDA